MYLIFIVFLIIGISFVTATSDVDAAKIKKPTIKMKAKPSCRTCHINKVKYKWFNIKFYNYCPHCKKYNTLRKNPKGVPEKEFTCRKCGADYCAVCGHDKHGKYRIHKKYKLIRV